MLKSQLLEIIANGENSGVEFKRDDLRPEQLAKEIVALLNVQGGQVLLGVEDDGKRVVITPIDLTPCAQTPRIHPRWFDPPIHTERPVFPAVRSRRC